MNKRKISLVVFAIMVALFFVALFSLGGCCEENRQFDQGSVSAEYVDFVPYSGMEIESIQHVNEPHAHIEINFVGGEQLILTAKNWSVLNVNTHSVRKVEVSE